MTRMLTAALLLATAPLAIAQSIGVKRTVTTQGDISIPGYEAVSAKVEIDPGIAVGWHRHHGDEIGTLLEGEVDMLLDGESPRRLRAGDGFIIPAGKVHDARNIGTGTARVIVTYVVEKGKPLAVPAK